MFTPFAYIVINLDPVLFRLGPFAVHWYGLAYVVAIALGRLWVVRRWAQHEGIQEEKLWPLALWAAGAELVEDDSISLSSNQTLSQDISCAHSLSSRSRMEARTDQSPQEPQQGRVSSR